ncbi:MAG: YgeY family selenium metabolism-linked hydrolase [Acholeplasmataceae bacterium]
MNIPIERILKRAEQEKKAITAFLRDMVRIPSESAEEEAVARRVKEEMERVGFDEVTVDGMGNVIGRIGSGKRLIAFDGHIDTVGIGAIENWKFDPYDGYEDEETIGGRGTSDQEGGVAAAVYAGKIIKDLGLEGDYTLLVTATVQEEDCDGLCWQYIIEEDGIRPEFVVITEPTSCRIYRGHRGRMEIKVSTTGISCHGSAPERGENAIYKMAPIIKDIEALNERLQVDPFLGKGTITVSEIFSQSPSRCAVADGCRISIDRRLTFGETDQSALEEIRALDSVKRVGAKVEMYDYARASYTGLVYPTEAYFPTWVLDRDHVVTRSLERAYHDLFARKPVIDKWTFSTNAVSIMGRYGIPAIGFGPGHEDQAHAPNEITFKDELVAAAAIYAAIPLTYLRTRKEGKENE